MLIHIVCFLFSTSFRNKSVNTETSYFILNILHVFILTIVHQNDQLFFILNSFLSHLHKEKIHEERRCHPFARNRKVTSLYSSYQNSFSKISSLF